MGTSNGFPVIRCPKCGTRILYSLPYTRMILGKPKIRQIITKEEMPLTYSCRAGR